MPAHLMEGTILNRLLLASAFAIAAVAALAAFEPVARAAPHPIPAQVTNERSPIIQVDSRCGRGRHYIPRHHVRAYRDRDGHYHRSHYVGGYCAHNH